MTKRVILYARVSTVNHGQDPELQLRELRSYCQRMEWEVVGEYVDRVSSGKTRPNLQQALRDAENHLMDGIVVWKFDRVARSAIELCQILERLNKVGVSFTSLTEQIDTSTAAGKLVFTVLGAVAEMERSLIRERTMAGLRNAHAKGHYGGRPRCKVLPEQIRLAVMDLGSVHRAAWKYGISYRTAFDLNKKVGKV